MQGTQISQNNLENEEQSWRTHTARFQNLLQSLVIKTVWYWHMDKYNRSMEWN